MAQGESDRNLLFGVLALQMDFITRDTLIAAMNAWVLEKDKPLGHILVERGDLDETELALLDPLVAKHVERHSGDPERSLESLTSVSWLRQDLQAVADPALHACVARLGAAPDGPTDPSDSTTLSVGGSTSTGQRFRILRPHASGGLGEVYVARDEELHREVALKQIKGGYADHPDSRSRFLLEAEVTGGLEHPGIVPVYGLGHYPDGRPFYAMRFIRGDSLKHAIERFHEVDKQRSRDPGERALALRRLLGRFVDVCNALAYAHSRGVLHRDLKPGNVMLGPYGETLVVDWGLAKVVGRPDDVAPPAEGTLRPNAGSGLMPTEMGAVVGTPAYMSPEQATGKLDELGPASDVYSLGAMLYSLLTGRAPFTDADRGTMLRNVQAGEFLPPRQVNRTVPLALEAIGLKAMAKEPVSRYPSPKALADEIEHWLADEPVGAWREPLSIRARRWIRRHRTAMTGASAAILAGLIGLAGVAAVQARSNRELKKASDATTKAKDDALAALAEAIKAKEATDAALAQSEEARKRAEAVLGFLKEDVLAAARPVGQEGGLGKDVSVREAVDAAEPKIAEAFRDQPIVEAEIRDTLGTTYHYLGEAALAIRQLERTVRLLQTRFGSDHPETLASRNNLAMAFAADGRLAEAIRIEEELLKLQESKLGPDHRRTLMSHNNLAMVYMYSGRFAEAIRLGEETIRVQEVKLGPDDPDTLLSRNNLALAYLGAGRTAEAIRMEEDVLKQQEMRLGPDHPYTLDTRNNLAEAYRNADRIAEAIQLQEETLKLREAKLGRVHPRTLQSRNNLANAYFSAGRYFEAIALHEETLRLRETKLGPVHPDTLQSMNNLATTYSAAGRMTEAVELFETLLRLGEATVRPDHPTTLMRRNKLAVAYESLGRWVDAERLRRGVASSRRKAEKPDSPLLAGDLASFGMNLLKQAKWSKAEPLLFESLAIYGKATPDDWRRYDAMSMLGGSLLGQGRYSEAESLIIGGYEGMKAREAKVPLAGRPRMPAAADRVVRLYEAWDKPEKASEWKARLGLSDLPADVFARP
jgi:eukaryotic-like serine/threonine-protein kinase